MEAINDNAATTSPAINRSSKRILGHRYRIQRLIGSGGMARVYEAQDVLLERTVAIKILDDKIAKDRVGLERFRREAMSLAAITSPHVVKLYDVVLTNHAAYLVMQRVFGRTLDEEVASNGPMAPVRCGSILLQLLEGLGEIHARGFIHRDIKPTNVAVDLKDHVVLLDLGIAFDTQRAPLTSPGMLAGTPGYLAPEALSGGNNDRKADLYQVGLLMLWMLTGIDPARKKLQGAAIAELTERLPRAYRFIANKALAVEPGERFASAADMASAVSLAIDSCATTEMVPLTRVDVVTEPIILLHPKSSPPPLPKVERARKLQREKIPAIGRPAAITERLPVSWVPPVPSVPAVSTGSVCAPAPAAIDVTERVHRAGRTSTMAAAVVAAILLLLLTAAWCYRPEQPEASHHSAQPIEATRVNATAEPRMTLTSAHGM